MLLPIAISAIVVVGTYFYSQLRYKRFEQYAIFPQLSPSLWLGHLKHIDQFIRSGKPNGHPDLAFAAINEALDRPPLMFLDLRPFGPPMVVVRSYAIAEQIVKPFGDSGFPYGLPKMPSVYGHMVHVTGRKSILPAAGEDWKRLRKQFNPGFSFQHLTTLLPAILDKSFIFLDKLECFASSSEPFSVVQLTGNLTFDIISSVVMNHDFGAQKTDPGRPDGLILAYHELFETYTSEQMDLPWFLTPRVEWKRRKLASRVRSKLRDIVRQAFDDRRMEASKPRSILSLSLQDVDSDNLTTPAVDEVCDQLNTFLFAGHDTTSILLSWMLYELSRTPDALQALRDELDSLFGSDPDPSAVRERLLSPRGQELLSSMTYGSAVIKETLRLWPPAGTARLTTPGTGIRITSPTGKEYPLEGVHVYNCAIIIQRDPEVYGDSANDFVPERWLRGDSIPAGAWRPFERGPRNCIGQELALLEAKVVLALVSRRFDFTKVGIGEPSLHGETSEPMLNEKGYFAVVEDMYPTRQVTPKPVDGMMMKVKKRSV